MGVDGSDVVKLRDMTTRPNIAYNIFEYEREEEVEEVRRLVEEKKEQYSLPGQIIVYCVKIKKAKRLPEVL
ncbi:hypothetical protein B0A55_13636, partial [Friedmanniomyces simplex]